MASALGTLFRISTWGESHGGGVGVVIDGCPPKLPISLEEVQSDLDRRRPGKARSLSAKKATEFKCFLVFKMASHLAPRS